MLAALLLSAAAQTTPALAPAPAPAPVERFDHISVQVVGRGEPIILIPGLSTPREAWTDVAARLSRTRRVYLVQVNGFGGDDPGANVRPGVLDGIVADLHRLVTRDRIAGTAVIGHSMGGLAALMLARAHPRDAGRIMLVDTLPFVGEIIVPGATVAMQAPQARAMRDAMAAAPPSPEVARAIAERNALTPAARARVAAWATAAHPAASAQAMYEVMSTDLRPDLPRLATPIRIVAPARSEPLYRRAYASARNMAYVPVVDAGHFVMLDQPARFTEALEAFLAQR
jgi:pimeloyl-ACP methyl ester carboxylesterase